MMYVISIIFALLHLTLVAATGDTEAVEDAPFCEKAMELSCGLPTEHCLFWDAYACQFTNLKDLCPKWCNASSQGRKMFIDPLADEAKTESDKDSERSICFFVIPKDCFHKYPGDICLKMHSHACSIPKVGELCKKTCSQEIITNENNTSDNIMAITNTSYEAGAVDAPYCDRVISPYCGQRIPMELCKFWDAYACKFHNLNLTCPTKCRKSGTEYETLLSSDPFLYEEEQENSSGEQPICDVLFISDCQLVNSSERCKEIALHSCRIPAVAKTCPNRCKKEAVLRDADLDDDIEHKDDVEVTHRPGEDGPQLHGIFTLPSLQPSMLAPSSSPIVNSNEAVLRDTDLDDDIEHKDDVEVTHMPVEDGPQLNGTFTLPSIQPSMLAPSSSPIVNSNEAVLRDTDLDDDIEYKDYVEVTHMPGEDGPQLHGTFTLPSLQPSMLASSSSPIVNSNEAVLRDTDLDDDIEHKEDDEEVTHMPGEDGPDLHGSLPTLPPSMPAPSSNPIVNSNAEGSSVADHPLCKELSVEDCDGPKAARVKKICPKMCAQKDSYKTDTVLDDDIEHKDDVEQTHGHGEEAVREEACCERILSSVCGLSEEVCELWKLYACRYRGFDKECPTICNKITSVASP